MQMVLFELCVQNGVDSMLVIIDLAEESGEGTKRASVLDQARVITKLLEE